MYQVRDIMVDRVFTVGPEATVDDAVSRMLNHQVSGLPVIDDQRRLVGVVSEIDIIDLVYNADLDQSTVVDYMTHEVRCLEADASLDDAAKIFCTQTIRRIPIVQEGRLVGIVSRRDLIRFVRDIRKNDSASTSSDQNIVSQPVVA
jgi:CBS domain-containing protein